MRQLRDQMLSYQDRLERDFQAQRNQEDAELRGRIKLRAEKLEEAVSLLRIISIYLYGSSRKCTVHPTCLYLIL